VDEKWIVIPRYKKLFAVDLVCGHTTGPVLGPERVKWLVCRTCKEPQYILGVREVCRG